MTEAERAAAYRLQHDAREAYQAAADAALAGDDTAAAAIREDWQPIDDFLREGPDVGERDEAGSEEGQRIN